MSAFAQYQAQAWPYRFKGTLSVPCIVGATPSDPRVAEGWLRSKLGDSDDLIRELVSTTMLDRGIDRDEALQYVDSLKHLVGFKRDENGLYLEGRCLKAAIKEAASVAVAAGKLNARGWGTTNKGLLNFIAEHVMVVEDRLPLGVTEPTRVMQRFIHTFRGNGIQYDEVVEDAEINFTVIADHSFAEKEWAMIWLTGEQQGVGANRSQGFGRYQVTRWEAVKAKKLRVA
jgi:hypothetical protein